MAIVRVSEFTYGVAKSIVNVYRPWSSFVTAMVVMSGAVPLSPVASVKFFGGAVIAPAVDTTTHCDSERDRQNDEPPHGIQPSGARS